MKPLYDSRSGKPRVAMMMSGSGTNAVELIKQATDYVPAFIWTDNPKSSNAKVISDTRKVRWDGIGFIGFYDSLGLDRKDETNLPLYYERVAEAFELECIHGVALAGYMRNVPGVFIREFPLITNVHPAILTVLNAQGDRKYVGDKAVQLMMDAKEEYIRSTVHIVNEKTDGGPILMLSPPMKLDYSKTPKENQDALKEVGDWVVYPRAWNAIGQGRFARDDSGAMHFDGKPIPNGVRLEDIH